MKEHHGIQGRDHEHYAGHPKEETVRLEPRAAVFDTCKRRRPYVEVIKRIAEQSDCPDHEQRPVGLEWGKHTQPTDTHPEQHIDSWSKAACAH
jgi:hypothetical protein